MTFADKGYQGARGACAPVQTPAFPAEADALAEGREPGPAKIRARGERAIAILKTWKVLVKLRCCPRRATAIVQAILVPHGVEANRYPD